LRARPRLLAHHAPRDVLQHEKHRPQVDRHHAVPVDLVDLEQRLCLDDPGVVEQDVEPTPPFVGSVDHALNVGGAGHVGLDGVLAKLAGERVGGDAVHVSQ
jgi:hypothetical protein